MRLIADERGGLFQPGRRGWLRFHEKGGKEHEAPCIPKLEVFLDEYVAAAGIAEDVNGPLFRTTGRSTGTPHQMTQQDAYRMIERRAKQAGIKTKIGSHSMRATGITDYLKHEGTLENAQQMAIIPRHAPPSSTTGAMRKLRSMSTQRWGFSPNASDTLALSVFALSRVVNEQTMMACSGVFN